MEKTRKLLMISFYFFISHSFAKKLYINLYSLRVILSILFWENNDIRSVYIYMKGHKIGYYILLLVSNYFVYYYYSKR